MNELTIKPQVDKLEEVMLSMPQVDCELLHKFEKGHYIREVRMPAGTIAIGHHQNFEHINIFVQGKVLMLNEDGSTKILEAPMTFIGKPGRKVGYILEDVVWQNVYPTEETNVELLEATYVTKSNYFHEHAAHMFALQSVSKEHDRIDYRNAIEELGYTEEQVQTEVQGIDDMIALPEGNYKAVIGLSPIHGNGIFATSNINAGEIIGPARINFYRTAFGRFTNHSATPNAEMVLNSLNNTIDLVALTDIVGALGGQPGQEITIDYRKAKPIALIMDQQFKELS